MVTESPGNHKIEGESGKPTPTPPRRGSRGELELKAPTVVGFRLRLASAHRPATCQATSYLHFLPPKAKVKATLRPAPIPIPMAMLCIATPIAVPTPAPTAMPKDNA